MLAVTMPTGSSWGAMTRRANKSLPSSSTAPIRAQAGTSLACNKPAERRIRCGTISPTKPMTPASATQQAVGCAQPRRRPARRPARDAAAPRRGPMHRIRQRPAAGCPSAPDPNHPKTRTAPSVPHVGRQQTPAHGSVHRTGMTWPSQPARCALRLVQRYAVPAAKRLQRPPAHRRSWPVARSRCQSAHR